MAEFCFGEAALIVATLFLVIQFVGGLHTHSGLGELSVVIATLGFVDVPAFAYV